MNRNEFLRTLGWITLSTPLVSSFQACSPKSKTAEGEVEASNPADAPLFFKISLAEWSLNKEIFSGKMSNLDFPARAMNDFGIDAVEYVNQFFMDKARDRNYLRELKMRSNDVGVTNVLIMCDLEGGLGDTDEKRRVQAVENHKKWVEAAQFLGCHAIRVNAYGEGSRQAVASAATDGLRRLALFARDFDINVIVENHGGYSSDGQWLSQVIAGTDMTNCGTLPDFGNFCIRQEEDVCQEWYDRYKGTKEMMPYAHGVSAKAHAFDAEGNCLETDYPRMLRIVKDAGYRGYIGIEYEGDGLSEEEGIRATQALLERVGRSLS